ncbi:hypothetical protein YH63_007665 [Afipia massiliensis]|uniref:Uncharacterized protein n=1 Tax=Afipia massiliensis TaxID=211460 RepID=A0A4U6BM33_9BRAD|nr:hypothetical protein [Afipia massiliensis]TKT71297.1 hypothetical protein YH63_007665 [Afipia massiliensis]
MKTIVRVLAIVSIVTASPALAADPVFPSGARVGLVPAEGLAVAKEFMGFESADQKIKVGLAEIPPAAFATVETAVKEGKSPAAGSKPEAFETAAGKAFITSDTGKDGATTIKMYSVIISGEKFTGYIIAQAREDAEKPLSDDAMRKMLASAKLRNDVPTEEQLSLMPFKIGELSDFKTVRTLAPRSSILLTDGTEDTTLDGAPYMVIGLTAAAPASPDDRGRFAQQTAAAIPGLRNARIISNEPQRIDGSAGYETRIEAVTGKNDTPVTVVQWLRFGGGTSLRIIASATRDDWPKAFPRFRAVRDGIDPR